MKQFLIVQLTVLGATVFSCLLMLGIFAIAGDDSLLDKLVISLILIALVMLFSLPAGIGDLLMERAKAKKKEGVALHLHFTEVETAYLTALDAQPQPQIDPMQPYLDEFRAGIATLRTAYDRYLTSLIGSDRLQGTITATTAFLPMGDLDILFPLSPLPVEPRRERESTEEIDAEIERFELDAYASGVAHRPTIIVDGCLGVSIPREADDAPAGFSPFSPPSWLN